MGNNLKPTGESSTLSESVEEGLNLSAGNVEDAEENVKQHKTDEGTKKEKVAKKANKVPQKDVTENGKNENAPPPKRQKRKFPSREEISIIRYGASLPCFKIHNSETCYSC